MESLNGVSRGGSRKLYGCFIEVSNVFEVRLLCFKFVRGVSISRVCQGSFKEVIKSVSRKCKWCFRSFFNGLGGCSVYVCIPHCSNQSISRDYFSLWW